MPPEEVLRVRQGMAAGVRRGGAFVVVPEHGRPVRLGAAAAVLWPLLLEGATFDELAAALAHCYPRAAAVREQLMRFLHQLRAAGLLEEAEASPIAPRHAPRLSFAPEEFLRPLVRSLRRAPVHLTWALLLAAVLAAGACIAVLLSGARSPRLAQLVHPVSWAGLCIVALGVVPLHELSHALAARLAGVSVPEVGLRRQGWWPLWPYVLTPALGAAPLSARFWVAAAGPLADLLVAGSASALMLSLDGESGALGAVRTVFLAALFSVVAGLNFAVAGDGAHLLEALLDDELLRRSAIQPWRGRFSSPRRVWIYRAACAAYWLAALLLLRHLIR